MRAINDRWSEFSGVILHEAHDTTFLISLGFFSLAFLAGATPERLDHAAGCVRDAAWVSACCDDGLQSYFHFSCHLFFVSFGHDTRICNTF